MKSYTINNRRSDYLIKERLVAEAAEETAADKSAPKRQYKGFESFQNLKAISNPLNIRCLPSPSGFTAIGQAEQIDRNPFLQIANYMNEILKELAKNLRSIRCSNVSNPIGISCIKSNGWNPMQLSSQTKENILREQIANDY